MTELADRLNDAAAKPGKRLPVLIEVKLSDEETKSGLDPEGPETAELLERLPDLAHLDTRGLMTIAPWGVAEYITRACFRSLRQCRDRRYCASLLNWLWSTRSGNRRVVHDQIAEPGRRRCRRDFGGV